MIDKTERIKEIENGIFSVGVFDAGTYLKLNPYLIIQSNAAVLINFCSFKHFPQIIKNISSITDIKKLKYIIVQSADVNISAALPAFEHIFIGSNVEMLTHNLNLKNLTQLNLKSKIISLSEQKEIDIGGRKIINIEIAFCSGYPAIFSYDITTKTLFTNSFMGSYSKNGDPSFKGKTEEIELFRTFSVQRFSSKNEINKILEKLKSLDIKRILPYYGPIVFGDNIKVLTDELKGITYYAD